MSIRKNGIAPLDLAIVDIDAANGWLIYAHARDMSAEGRNGCTMNMVRVSGADIKQLVGLFGAPSWDKPIKFRFDDNRDNYLMVASRSATISVPYIYM